MIFLRTETIRAAIIRSTMINFFARIIGYFKFLTIIYLFGFSSATDTFFLALGIVEFFLIVADVFDSVGVPNLVRKSENEREFKKLAATILTFILVLGITLIILLLLTLPLIKLIVGNYASLEISALGVIVIFLIPYFFSTLLFHHFGALLRAKRRFSLFFIGELCASIGALLCIILFYQFYAHSIILPIAFSIGQCIAAVFLAVICRKYIILSWEWDTDIIQIIRQFYQLSLVYSCTAATNIINRFFGMLLPVKSITALTYGSMTSLASRNIIRLECILIVPLSEKRIESSKLFRYSFFVFAVYTIAAIFLFLFSDSIIKFLFGYGNVSGIDINLTASVVKYYAIGLPFLALSSLYYRVFQILDKLFILMRIGVISTILLLTLNFIFYKLQFGIEGLVIATSLTNIFLAFVSIASLRLKQNH